MLNDDIFTGEVLTKMDIVKRTLNLISFKELYNKDLPPIEYLVDGIIPKASLNYVFGPPGSFKTNFLMYLTLCGITGNNIFDFHVEKPFTTLWIDEENRDIGMKDKVVRLVTGMGLDPEVLKKNNLMISNNLNILSPQDMANLEIVISQTKPDLIVIDSIAKVFPLSERDETDVKKIFTILKPLIVKYGVTIVFIHHARKMNHQQKGYGMEDIAGTREFAAQCDSLLCVEPIKRDTYKLSQYKNRHRDKIEPIIFSVNGDDNKLELEYLGTSSEAYEATMNRKNTEISDFIMMRRCDVKAADIINYMKIQKGTPEVSTKKHLKNMTDNGLLEKPKRGYYRVTD